MHFNTAIHRLKPLTAKTRSEYINFKVLFTPSELNVFKLDEKQVKEFYLDNGYHYNEQEHFRTFLLNLNNPEILKILFKLYLDNPNQLFKAVENVA